MSRELEILFEKCASLVFEMEAFRDAPNGAVIHRPVGSGIFFAPCQALTAKHVVTDMHNVNPDWADHVRRQTDGYRWLPYFGSASQIVDLRVPNRTARWGLTNVWPSPVSDIAMLQFAPVDDDARELLNRMRPLFPRWSLLPPPVGTTVTLCGQPRDPARSESAVSNTVTYMCQPATVVESFETRLDRGMYNFPCFTVDREVPHGMSGGPVFWEDRLCGVVSGGFWGQTVIASLWPICLTQFENQTLGDLNATITFESLLETGQVIAVDWPLVRGNVSYELDERRQIPLLRPPR